MFGNESGVGPDALVKNEERRPFRDRCAECDHWCHDLWRATVEPGGTSLEQGILPQSHSSPRGEQYVDRSVTSCADDLEPRIVTRELLDTAVHGNLNDCEVPLDCCKVSLHGNLSRCPLGSFERPSISEND